MQLSYIFTETSPASPSTAASSVAVAGVPAGTPAGIITSGPVDWTTADSMSVTAELVGATGGVLDIYIQTSFDGGTKWWDYVHFAQLAAGASAIRYAFTASPVAVQNANPVVVGINLTPALAANTILGGAWGDRFRLVMVAGGGTTVGAAVSVRLSATHLI